MAKLVDAPGYGFAGVSRFSENRYKLLLKRYLSESSRLSKIFWCINPRHGLNENDRIFFNFAKHLQLQVHLVFTKADELEQLILFERVKAICQIFKVYGGIVDPIVNITSTKTGLGMREIRMAVKQAVLEAPNRTIKAKGGKIEYFLEDEYSNDDMQTFKLIIEKENKLLFSQNKLEFKKQAADE